ncbi:unnamed protein product [Penicillium nalgiovense]|uniref:Uncharacterized protein n=1 Tax=Penicillium nalgiovense TaxID=60175 RepID=A0A9W4MQR9_PENNA|nr:unnamed protein product [Penicillium nalgiovense]CAG7979606.1 unnamed protein product [Penicillium nalgiovense]CAG7979763.1 unnamed protein product [Penicillium nalgiovense]CAG7980869.1 unnamed protein product [Penicillium nalgiovense]CAG7981115.1 unnamed protein product [Penicillium nalgiovense]
MDDGPPPPPPPHGENPNTTQGEYRKSSDLPDGNYDIFIVPPHSAGSGFLYLPSLQCNRNSFLAGVASTLLACFVWSYISPIVKAWYLATVASGSGTGMAVLAIGVGVAGWLFGSIQSTSSGDNKGNGGARGGRFGFGGFGGSGGPGGPGDPGGPRNAGPNTNQYSSGANYGGNGAGQQRQQGGNFGGGQPHGNQYSGNQHGSGPPPNSDNNKREKEEAEKRAKEERAKEERAREQRAQEERAREERAREERAREERVREERAKQERAREERIREERAREERIKEERAREERAKERAKEEAERERAREETRRKEELRRKMEEFKRKRDAEAKEKEKKREREAMEKELQERREQLEKEVAAAKAAAEKEARERLEREAAEARERQAKAEAEAKAKLEKLEAEAKEKAAKEAAEKEAAAKAAAQKEAMAKFAALKEAASKKYAEKKAQDAKKEAAAKSPPPKPASTSNVPRTPSPKKPAPYSTAKTAKTANEDDAYSFRPYDRPRRPYAAGSVYSESSYTPSNSTARTTPPPSHRSTYSTKDPDKIVIQGVYAFNNAFMKTPVAQLVSGQGMITDGLVLRITTEGLFVDDDLRGIGQREWDVKAWTLKLAEVWCPQVNATSSAKTASSNPFSFRRGNNVPTNEESEAFLGNLLKVCKNTCRLASPSACFARSATASHGGGPVHPPQAEFRGLHILRASVRDQEGKKFVFVLQDTEAWKVAIGLQRLRGGALVRALGVSALPVPECKTMLSALGYA